MTAPLPPQSPTPPPRYRFRPRSDRNYRLPAFQDGRPPRLHAEPFEPAEARPFDPSELWDARLLRDAVLGFVLLCVVVFAMSVVGWAP